MPPTGEARKNLGAFYTPDHTANYMVGLLGSVGRDKRFLEPCGGDGVFVKSLVQSGVRPPQIEVWDINPDVGKTIGGYGTAFKQKDSLLETDFAGLFRPSFDVIVGNPPYLNKQSQYLKRNKRLLQKIYREIGANDTYAMFIYMATNLLAPGGQLVFIVSDTYRTLGIHKKLRGYLLNRFTVKQITVCPPNLFKDIGASVHTSIIHVVNSPAASSHAVVFNDCSRNAIGDYAGQLYGVKQAHLKNLPDCVFNFGGDQLILNALISAPLSFEDVLDGGLGMHTTSNAKYLARINYGNDSEDRGATRVPATVDIKHVGNGKEWRFYHKTGGDNAFYKKPGHAIRWTADALAVYKMMEPIKEYRGRKGFIVSGVCGRLSARMMWPDAAWESNKAMAFFPRQADRYPTEFFIGLINSRHYESFRRILNHTNSVQVRDIRKLPFFNFHKEDVSKIAGLATGAIDAIKDGRETEAEGIRNQIDSILDKYIYGEVRTRISQKSRANCLQAS
jgi:hypothetical protein